ncbi:MAG: hypothetical protein ACK4GL_08820 [Flavobacteriales bacterium]
MKTTFFASALLFVFSQQLFSQTKPKKQIDYTFDYNDPSNVAKLLILGELTFDGSIGNGMFLGNINLGMIARYSLSQNTDFQTKFRKSIGDFHSNPGYRKNFEAEAYGALFVRDKIKNRQERVIVSSKESGNMVEVVYFDTDLPQRNSFGFNAGLNYKTCGLDPNETYDPASGDGYKGPRGNVNFSAISIIGGLQFKRINASVISLKGYRKKRYFDNYTVMTFDGIFSPVNAFTDGITGENVGKELKDSGLRNSLPFGARFTYNVYGSIPASDKAKSVRYSATSSIGFRPYLGFTFDFGLGFMLFRQK